MQREQRKENKKGLKRVRDGNKDEGRKKKHRGRETGRKEKGNKEVKQRKRRI